MSSQTLPKPTPEQLAQEKLQIAQLDGMMLTGFKAQNAPESVYDKWDEFMAEFKRWKGIE